MASSQYSNSFTLERWLTASLPDGVLVDNFIIGRKNPEEIFKLLPLERVLKIMRRKDFQKWVRSGRKIIDHQSNALN